MSYVTSVTIVVEHASSAFESAVTSESDFGRGGMGTTFAELDMHAAGGTKYSGHRVFAAGLNYADRETLRAWVDALPWYGFGCVLVDTEGDHPEAWVYGVGGEDVILAGTAT